MNKYKANDKYKVKCFETEKDKVKENNTPKSCQMGIFPKKLEQLGILCVGRTGAGKTNVLLHMLTDANLLGGVFKPKDIFLYSALTPDKNLTKHLHIPKKNIITNWDEAKFKQHLEKIENVSKKDWAKAPYTMIILDDVLQKKKFLKSATMSNLATTHRHMKVCYAILAQYYKAVSPVVRTNCSYIIYFAGSEMENIKLCEEQLPAFMNRKKFMQCVEFATKDPYSFLTINTRAEHNKKLRKGFNTIIN